MCVSLNLIEIIVNDAVRLFNFAQLSQELLSPCWSLFSWIYNRSWQSIFPISVTEAVIELDLISHIDWLYP